ncbi:MAG: sporulation protein [Thermoleophilia bacterium]|nr:sporulation protein [Thermoleophilia bacterium]
MAEDGNLDGIGGLAERVGARAGAQVAYGVPVERDGVTVIPVARTRWGFGGGSGHGGDPAGAQGEGSGGGGGVVVSPIGYIELSEGRARYRPIRDPLRVIPGALLALAVVALLVRRLLR